METSSRRRRRSMLLFAFSTMIALFGLGTSLLWTLGGSTRWWNVVVWVVFTAAVTLSVALIRRGHVIDGTPVAVRVLPSWVPMGAIVAVCAAQGAYWPLRSGPKADLWMILAIAAVVALVVGATARAVGYVWQRSAEATFATDERDLS